MISAHMDGLRPLIRGTKHVVTSGHHLASMAAVEILEAGGNAADAGVAGGLVLGIVQSHYVNVAGVAPIIFRDARGVVRVISGVGYWPKATTLALFEREFRGTVPQGVLRTVVPAAPDAWLTALEHFGSMRFSEVASAAIRLAREGFVMYPHMAAFIADHAAGYGQWKSNAEIYLPHGAPPVVDSLFHQRDLASTLSYMADRERQAPGDRQSGLRAARKAFYEEDIASTIVAYHRSNGGLLSADDLRDFHVEIEAPIRKRWDDVDVYTCGPWCQGPVLLQILNLLRSDELRATGHNTADYVATLLAAIEIAFRDRDRFYGDPRFVNVPLDDLLSADYASHARASVAAAKGQRSAERIFAPSPIDHGGTSFISVIDAQGNAFAATPSDVSHDTPVIPGTGLCPSSRGSQSWALQGHPSAIEAGKRPRLTPNPAIAVKDGLFVQPFGSPGGDVQVQAMLQVFLNMHVFGMNPQAAVEAPRFSSYGFPASFEPHASEPNVARLEGRFPDAVFQSLRNAGVDAQRWPEWTQLAGGVCVSVKHLPSGVLSAAADPRRACYAVGR